MFAPRHLRATLCFWGALFLGMMLVYGLNTWLPEIMRAATKGIVHKNTASRKVSRLAARLKSVGA